MKLLDHVKETYGVPSDAELSRKLKVSPPIISRIRNGKCQVSAEIMIRIHEAFDMSIKDIKAML